VIKHVVNNNCGSSSCPGLAAGDFRLQLSIDNGTPTTFPGAESPGTTFSNLKNGDTYTITEDLTHQPSGDLSAFYSQSFNPAHCDTGSVACTPESERHKTCTVINDDILLQNQRSINVTENPWTYTPSPVRTGTVTSIAGSFHIVNASNNQPNNVLVANMSVLLEVRKGNKGQFQVAADPATCTFTPAAPFIFTTTQDVTFSCNVSGLGFTATDVVKATVRVNLFQGHTTFTSAFSQQLQ